MQSLAGMTGTGEVRHSHNDEQRQSQGWIPAFVTLFARAMQSLAGMTGTGKVRHSQNDEQRQSQNGFQPSLE